ncbi:MAG: hypothetical protein COA79_05695 [Planctomycetota bacterium]|nr:MAG: hypothetical protein COA79_05695 [Planctomycetota bacterium]
MNENFFEFQGEKLNRFVLGGAQLGLNYGIANKSGKPEQAIINSIVEECYHVGVNLLDTAQAYGQSEISIGIALKNFNLTDHFKIISKLDPARSTEDFNWVYDSILKSVQDLNVDSLWGLMLHRFDLVEHLNNGLLDQIKKLKEDGLVKHFGVSVYNIKELVACKDIDEFSIFQVPCNLWTPQLILENVLEGFKKKDKLVFVRSIFLQGLLLMKRDDVAKKAPFAIKAFDEWIRVCSKFNMVSEDLCFAFANSLNTPVVFGMESPSQVLKNKSFMGKNPLNKNEIEEIYNILSEYLTDKIINPSLW